MDVKHFHFSAICGTAMASLAVLLKKRGHIITGSDENIYPPMSDYLVENQVELFSGYHRDHLEPRPDVVVIGNVLSRGNPEVEYALEARMRYISMAELLKSEFIRGNISVVVSGTHGKTTTTSLAAHVFDYCGKPTGFFVGGIPLNFGYSSRDVEKGGYFITEGDEYDTCFFDKRSKFFHYLPERLILTGIEFDHADIFQNVDEIKESFSLMLRQIPRNGLIIVNGDNQNAMDVVKRGFSPYITFGVREDHDAVISHCYPKSDELGMVFNLAFRGDRFRFDLPLMGEFNVRNAVSVILLALSEGIHVERIQEALSSFKNVRRRLERLTQNDSIQVFDDFAHHPTAIGETLHALRQAWKRSRLIAVYEARSNTSVRKFHQDTMAPAFTEADVVLFSGLYRKEKIDPRERLDIEKIVRELKREGKEALLFGSLENLEEYCEREAQSGDIFAIMSNGSFGGIQRRLAKKMDERC